MRHVAFSAGARNCVGQPLAIRMIPTIAAVLLRSFNFELQDPDHFKLRLKRVGRRSRLWPWQSSASYSFLALVAVVAVERGSESS
jgi:cytochrome P450